MAVPAQSARGGQSLSLARLAETYGLLLLAAVHTVAAPSNSPPRHLVIRCPGGVPSRNCEAAGLVFAFGSEHIA